MADDLVPADQISDLSLRVDTPFKAKLLQYLDRQNFLNHAGLEQETLDALEQLQDDRFVQPGLTDDGEPFSWVITGNGTRVLTYLGLR